MSENRKSIKRRSSLQLKLIGVIVFTSVIVSSVNILLFQNMNGRVRRIDEVYSSNVSLNQLSDTLFLVHSYMAEYLNTKNFDSMQNFYKSVEEYQILIESLPVYAADSNARLMEKNIRSLSKEYLSFANETVEAKRGRLVEKYNNSNKQATELYGYINTYIYSLNNMQFKNNSDNYMTLVEALRSLEYVIMIVLFGVTVINIILALVLTRSITFPLGELVHAANEVRDGNLEVEELLVRGNDEISVVINAFNKMTSSIREYIQSTRESMELERVMREKEMLMETHLKDAQLKYLQAQVNPHFLFNTLNAGAQLAMMEEADRTYTFINNMAAFFRYSIRQDKHETILLDEIALVDNYLYILNVRFSNEIIYVKEINQDLCHIHVPHMILQPIVENCINYGIRDIDWEGVITLSIYQKDHVVCVSIKDNGVGIKPERIGEIMHGTIKRMPSDSSSNGIGIHNVRERLRLFYNLEETISIDSHGENQGTEVILYLKA